MKKSRQSAADNDDHSCISPPFSCLPNDVVLEILNKVLDLKTLCVCQVVSKRFYEIVRQVDAIFYTHPLPFTLNSFIKCKSFLSVMTSIQTFNRVKSLCFQFSSSSQVLYKWKVKLGKNRVDTLVFVSPASIYDKNNNGLLLYGDPELPLKVSEDDCFHDGILSIIMLKYFASCSPSLEKVFITDSDNRVRVSANGREKVDELRNWVDVDFPDRIFACYIPLLELPVSGYAMKGVKLFLLDRDDDINDVTYERFINYEIDTEHDKQEAAYDEAIKEIFKKHRGSFMRTH